METSLNHQLKVGIFVVVGLAERGHTQAEGKSRAVVSYHMRPQL